MPKRCLAGARRFVGEFYWRLARFPQDLFAGHGRLKKGGITVFHDSGGRLNAPGVAEIIFSGA